MPLTIQPLVRFTERRTAWFLLLITALALEGCALFFQHVMKLDPCAYCVYERVAVLGIALAAIIGWVQPRWLLLRLVGFVLWGYSAWRGFELTQMHVRMEKNPLLATCSYTPDFPSWAPLHEWVPSVFQPTGLCDQVQWRLLNMSMAEWLHFIFAAYLGALALVLIIRLVGNRFRL